MPESIDPAIIRLNNVRLSFPNLFVAKAIEEGKEPKYGCTLLLDSKTHAKEITQLEHMIDRVALDFFKKKVTLKNVCLRDGNEKPEMEGYGDGIMFVPARCDKRPPVVDRDLSPLAAEDGKIYAGCYVNTTIRLYAYDHPKGGKGVSAGLRAVQFVKDGDSFGAGPVNAENEFESLMDDPMF